MDIVEEIIPSLKRLLDGLEKIQEERGMPKEQELINKNITNSSLSDEKVKSSLDNVERKRLKEAFTLFSEVFFDYKKKTEPDVKPKTLMGEVAKPIQKQQEAPKEIKKGGFLDFLMPIVIGLGAIIGGAISLIGSFFQGPGLVADTMKVLGKIGLVGGLKVLSKTFLKAFALPVLKRIPIIGSLISFYFAYKEFSEGNIMKGVFELASGLLNLVPGVGTFLSIGLDILKIFLESKGVFDEGGALSNTNAWGTIKGWMSKAGDWIMDNALNLPIIGTFKRFTMAWDAFTNGQWGEGFKQIGIGLISIGGGGEYMEKGINWVLSYFNGDSKVEEGSLNSSGVMGTINGWIGSIGSWISENSLYLPIIGGIQRFGMAWDSFSAGDLGEGFKQLGMGLATFVGGGPIIAGIEMLHGWLFGSEQQEEGEFQSKSGWMGRIKNWIKTKLKDLPTFLRKPLEWMGILDETNDNTQQEISAAGEGGKNKIEDTSKGFFSTVADTISDGLNKAGDIAGGLWDSVTNVGKQAFDSIKNVTGSLYDSFVEYIGKGVDISKGMFSSYLESLKSGKLNGEILGKFENDNKSSSGGISVSSSKESVELIKTVATRHLQLMATLVNISSASLNELKRINGSSGSSSAPAILPLPLGMSSGPNMMSFGDNRSEYATSVYTLA